MAHVWQGVINEYRDRLPFADDVKAVTLGEGGTPADSRAGTVC